MAQNNTDVHILETSTLLTCYSFDLRGLTPLGLINNWLETHSLLWIRLAVVEALYQGRYKAVSVEHLLNFWSRRGQPIFHFGREFELLISNNLPKSYSENAIVDPLDAQTAPPVPQSFPIPNFPAPPSLLRPILDKPPIILPNSDLLETMAEESIPSENLKDTDSEIDPSAIAVETQSSANTICFPSRSIHQFIPVLDESDLFGKLRTVVRRELAEAMTA